MKNNNSLKDNYNRTIDYLRISITDKCNLRCVYCMPEKGVKNFSQSDVLTDNEIVRFVRIARKHGLKKVRITGGEPLIRKNITGLISSINETGIKELGLTTNGIKLSEHAHELKKAGLDRVNISLDTLDPERYRGITKGGDITLVLESIKVAEKEGLAPIKINMVPIKGINDDEILSFANLTLGNDYHIRFIEFMPATCSGIWKREKCVSSAEVLEKISALGELEKFEFRGRGPSRNYRIKGARGVIGVISPISDHFCGFCNRLRLTADGKIRPCLFSNERIDIRTPMRNGASDSDIEDLLRRAIEVKPQRHELNEDGSSISLIKTMSKIGG
jgi:cyclic pyranopterin phosphate synthase